MRRVITSVAALSLAAMLTPAQAQDMCDGHVEAPMLMCPAEVEIELDAHCEWRATADALAPGFPADRPGVDCEAHGAGFSTGSRMASLSCTDTCDDNAQGCEVRVRPVDVTAPTIQVATPDVVVYLAEGASASTSRPPAASPTTTTAPPPATP